MSGEDDFLLFCAGVFLVLYWIPVLLPRRWGLPLAAILVAVAGLFTVANMTDEPSRTHVDLGPYLRSIMGIIGLSGAVGALAFHLVARTKGHPWRWRAVFLVGAVAASLGLVEAYIKFF